MRTLLSQSSLLSETTELRTQGWQERERGIQSEQLQLNTMFHNSLSLTTRIRGGVSMGQA